MEAVSLIANGDGYDHRDDKQDMLPITRSGIYDKAPFVPVSSLHNHRRHISPTGKRLETTGITVVRIVDGKFVAGWQNWDMLGLMQQIKEEPMAPTYIAAKVGKKASG